MPDREPSQTASDTTSTLEEQLAQKKKEVDDDQIAVAQNTQKLAKAQGELQALQRKVNDIQQTLGGYDKTQAQRLQDIKSNLDEKIADAKKVLKGVTDKIDGIMKKFDEDLNGPHGQKGAVDAASMASGDASKAVDAAQTELNNKQKDYADLKAAPKGIETTLQQLKGALDQINKAQTQYDYVAMYFLSTDAKTASGDVKIPSADDYEKKVRIAQTAIDTATDNVTKAKSAAATALDTYTQLQQKYDAAVKSRQADLLSALKGVDQKAA